jgi:uncharacterized protein (DUF433 family)
MTVALQAETPPIREDESGALRIGASKVLLDVVLHEYNAGAAPEQIVQSFPSVTLADVYFVIAYYLRHRAQMDAYLGRRQQEAAELRKVIEAEQPPAEGTRARLLARRKAGQ